MPPIFFYQSEQLTPLIKDKFIFFDTNIFIAATKYRDAFTNLISDLHEAGSTIVTISSVVFEYTRGSDSFSKFNAKTEFIKSLADIWPVEKFINSMEKEIVLVQKQCNETTERQNKDNMSYPDFQLLLALLKFPSALLLTENHKHMPLSILDRKFILTLDTGLTIRNHAFYQINPGKVKSQIAEIPS